MIVELYFCITPPVKKGGNRARRKQDKESADLPTGAYIDVRNLGKTQA